MDILSYGDSAVHRIESRAKLITTICFIVYVVSFERYEVAMLLPFLIYPVFLVTAGDLPVLWLLKKIVYVSPFALMIAAFNPLLDREVVMRLGSAGITGGWISFVSIMLRFVLTVGTALAMIAVTGFQSVCLSLNRLGMPRMFTLQLLFLYRYLFVLAEEASRMSLARSLRSYDGREGGMRAYSAIVGNLLLRTINRAQRIYVAMSCRGFDGHIHVMRRESFGARELFFIVFWCGLFTLFRFVNIPRAIGALVTGAL